MNCRFSRALHVWSARESSVDSREGIIYRVKGEGEEGSARLLAPSAMYYLVPGTMGFVCKSFETRNQAERPPTSRASCSGSSKGPEKCRGMQTGIGRRIGRRGDSKFVRRCILGCGGTSFKSGRAKGNARKRGEEKWRRAAAEPFYIMRRCVSRELHNDTRNKCAMKRRMRKGSVADVTYNFGK